MLQKTDLTTLENTKYNIRYWVTETEACWSADQNITTCYQQVVKKYQTQHCCNCSFKNGYTPDFPNKRINPSPKLEAYKQKVITLLTSEKGLTHRQQSAKDVEPTFTAIKHNRNFKIFITKGLINVEIDTGLIAIFNKLKKKAA